MSTLSLASVLAESARRHPDSIALVEGEVRLDYRTVWEQARAAAASLAARGVTPGTPVALLAPNGIDFVRAYYGILAVGGVVVPIPTLLQPREIQHLLQDSGAALLLHASALETTAVEAVDGLSASRLSIADIGGDQPPVATFATRRPDDTAVIFYTSGTTGRPKGALLTHLNLVLNATVNVFDANPFDRSDVVLGCLPMFHTFGQTVALNSTFRVGATLVLQPRFDAATAVELMIAEEVTMFLGVPTMYVQLVAAAAERSQSPRSLRTCISGGAPLPVTVLEAFEQAFGCPVYEGYGLSETSPTASVNQPWFGTRAGTVGHPIWGVDVEIADESVQDEIILLPTGERGEIVIRGHNIFAGYLNNPEASAAVLVDGWFRSGDIGIKDADGFVAIVDRTKDLILRGGYNVYPREVEDVLVHHPDIDQVAVIGLPDDEKGEEVCAVVVPAAGRVVVEADVVSWARERLGAHKYPRRIEVVEQLPLGPSHKVLKRELRAQLSG